MNSSHEEKEKLRLASTWENIGKTVTEIPINLFGNKFKKVKGKMKSKKKKIFKLAATS